MKRKPNTNSPGASRAENRIRTWSRSWKREYGRRKMNNKETAAAAALAFHILDRCANIIKEELRRQS